MQAVRKEKLKVIERPVSLRDMLEAQGRGRPDRIRQTDRSRPRAHRAAEASR
jgi:hypothetical protein